MSSKNEVATKDDAMPAMFNDMLAEDAGAGNEGVDQESVGIPFLRIVQKTSPMVEEGRAEYLKGAKPGMFVNTITKELYDEIEFHHCAFNRRFIQWGAGASGGFSREMTIAEFEIAKESGQFKKLDNRWYQPLPDGVVNPNKCDVVQDTRSHFGVIVTPGGAQPVIMALSSTQIKKSKQIMYVLNNAKITQGGKALTPPTWLTRLKLTTALEQNDEGSWHGLVVENDGFVFDEGLYVTCKEFHDIVQKGEAEVNYNQNSETAPGDVDTGEGKTGAF